MRITLLKSTVIALAAAVSGCATTGGKTFTPSADNNASTVKAKWLRESAFVWEGYEFISIDDKFVSKGFLSDGTGAILKVEPGPRSFVIGVKFNRGWGTGPYEALVPMKAVLEPNATYQLTGEVSGARVKVWLEDVATQANVSSYASSTWGHAPPPPTPIPIFIPAR